MFEFVSGDVITVVNVLVKSLILPVSFSTFDAPNTTSSVTYTSTWQISSGGGFNTAQATRRMIIFEMSA